MAARVIAARKEEFAGRVAGRKAVWVPAVWTAGREDEEAEWGVAEDTAGWEVTAAGLVGKVAPEVTAGRRVVRAVS